MTKYINRNIVGYDQFLADYVAVTQYRIPNLERVLEEHAMETLRSVTPEQFPATNIPPFMKTYGGKKKREFTFVYQWNESTERFDMQYTGFALTANEVEFFDTKFTRWEGLEADYRKQAKKGHTINFEDLKYDVFKRLAGKSSAPEHGKMCKVWLRDTESKSGSRCWFSFVFLLEDNEPVIRYEGYVVLELAAYKVTDVRFERWAEFEAYAKNLIKPEHMFNFEELKAELAQACPVNPASSYSKNVWVGGDKTVSRRGYRFWFEFENEDGTPRIRYTRYSFS
ncbi:MAG: hypothetical protein FWD84_03320 [Oscillospiraceae bacterium]|nr:hypothetical protein [Oscillospiraceae bacterium]